MPSPPFPARPAQPGFAPWGMAAAAFILPSLAIFAALGSAPLLALLAVALIATDWRASLAAVGSDRTLLVLLFLITLWGALTAAWSPVPEHSLGESGRFLAISAAGLVVCGRARGLDERAALTATYCLAAGLLLALALLQVEIRTDESIARWLGGPAPARLVSVSRYDRGVTVVLLSAWPAVMGLLERGRWLAAALIALAVAVTVPAFNSRTDMLALLAAPPAVLIAWRAPRIAAAGLLGMLALLAFLLPLLPPGGADIERLHRAAPWFPESAIHRLVIWRFTADRIGERPFLGWGMDASRALPGGKTPAAAYLPPVSLPPQAEALPLHPHDGALQWRVELGIPGALLCLATVGLLLWRLAGERTAPRRRALLFGYASSALVVAMLSFGAWQAWWLSLLWLTAAFALAMLPRPGPAAA